MRHTFRPVTKHRVILEEKDIFEFIKSKLTGDPPLELSKITVSISGDRHPDLKVVPDDETLTIIVEWDKSDSDEE